MTSKEKAIKLIDRFIQTNGNSFYAKECALIAVDEIIDIAYWEYMESMGGKEKEFWEEVKTEIQNL